MTKEFTKEEQAALARIGAAAGALPSVEREGLSPGEARDFVSDLGDAIVHELHLAAERGAQREREARVLRQAESQQAESAARKVLAEGARFSLCALGPEVDAATGRQFGYWLRLLSEEIEPAFCRALHHYVVGENFGRRTLLDVRVLTGKRS